MVFRPYLPTINVKTLFCKISFLIFWNNILTFSSIVAFAFVIVQFSRCRIREIIPLMVGLRGLEPPTSRLSGVRSNHLSYKPILWSWRQSFRSSSVRPWWRWGESNSWPPACKAGALPAELHPHLKVVTSHFAGRRQNFLLSFPFLKVQGFAPSKLNNDYARTYDWP